MEYTIQVQPGAHMDFENHACDCIGTGRMDLALQEEYQEELRQVQRLCHFRHIRGHGLFSDGMAIYAPVTDADGIRHDQYCFTYLDRVMDSYRKLGLTPVLELGFMPSQMASGNQTLFYWTANVTPPAEEKRWTALIEATLEHLCERYGRKEVALWPVEVWNEPNLPGFWENADKQAYFRLYEISVQAVRRVVPGIRVGGPAICGGAGSLEWVRDFLACCRERKLPVDFLTRHTYMGQKPERKGRYLYHEMCRPDDLIDEVRATRSVMEEFEEYRRLPIYITEFNTSYNPFCPIHDTCRNAVILCSLLSKLGDVADSYSYWTFGDVFEEQGVPATLFHGGFGLMAAGCIPKPSLWAFHFFANLEGECVHRDSRSLILHREDGSYEMILWHPDEEVQETEIIRIELPWENQATVLSRRIDETHGNPLKVWLDMGQPRNLREEELGFLKNAACPETVSQCMTAQDGRITLEFTLKKNSFCHIRLMKHAGLQETGYLPDMYL